MIARAVAIAYASVEVARQDVGSGSELPIWAGLTLMGAVTALLLFLGMTRATRRAEAH